jgi:hypothetical protein
MNGAASADSLSPAIPLCLTAKACVRRCEPAQQNSLIVGHILTPLPNVRTPGDSQNRHVPSVCLLFVFSCSAPLTTVGCMFVHMSVCRGAVFLRRQGVEPAAQIPAAGAPDRSRGGTPLSNCAECALTTYRCGSRPPHCCSPSGTESVASSRDQHSPRPTALY